MTPFEAEGREQWKQLGLRDVGRLLAELPKSVCIVIAGGLKPLQHRVWTICSERRREVLPVQERLARKGRVGALPDQVVEPALRALVQQRQRVAYYANGLPKVRGKKRSAEDLTDGDTHEPLGEAELDLTERSTAGPSSLPPEVLKLWHCPPSDLFIGNRSQDTLLFNQGELSVGNSNDLQNRIHLGGTVVGSPPKRAYFASADEEQARFPMVRGSGPAEINDLARKGVAELTEWLEEEEDWARARGRSL